MSSDDNDKQVLKRMTLRELRDRAVKSLGSKVAAGLKLKEELVQALSARASKAAAKVGKAAAKVTGKAASKSAKTPEKAKEKEKAKGAPPKKVAAPPPKKSPPKKVAAPIKAALSKKAAPAKAAPAKAAPAKAPAKVAKPVGAAPAKLDKPSKAEAVAEVYELPITRDFFIDPRRAGLPASYGDDRLLCFRREPLAIVVSWDLSAATFADGQGLTLELLTAKGRLVGSVPVTAPTGLATFDALPEGTPLSVQVVRQGRVLTRGRPFMLGAARDEATQASEQASERGPWQMTVPPDGPLSDAEQEPWADAPPGGQRARVGRASSSRLSS